MNIVCLPVSTLSMSERHVSLSLCFLKWYYHNYFQILLITKRSAQNVTALLSLTNSSFSGKMPGKCSLEHRGQQELLKLDQGMNVQVQLGALYHLCCIKHYEILTFQRDKIRLNVPFHLKYFVGRMVWSDRCQPSPLIPTLPPALQGQPGPIPVSNPFLDKKAWEAHSLLPDDILFHSDKSFSSILDSCFQEIPLLGD